MMNSSSNLAITYLFLVLIWATTPLAIVWSVSDIHLSWALVLRFLLALPLALLILKMLNIKLPMKSIAIHSYIAGAFSLIGSQSFTYIATQYLSSGMIALMFGLTPIMAGLIGRFVFGQSLHWLKWLGMVVAISGLVTISFAGSSQHIQPIGIILMLCSVLCYASSIFWVQHINAPIEPMAQATGSILCSTIVSVSLLPFIWQYAPTHLPNMKSLLALSYAVIMASLVAMFCYFKLVKSIKATTLSLSNVMTPVLALVIGALFNHETFTLGMLVGTSILIFGLCIYFLKDFKTLYLQK